MRSLKTRGGITRGGGMTDSVRLVWVGRMHRRVGIYETMTTLSTMKRDTSEQHVQLTSSHRQRDMKSMEKIILWFDNHSPCDPTMEALQSFSTGLAASDGDNINCNNAENVELQMQRKLDGVRFEEISMKRNNQIRSLVCLQDSVKVDNEKVQTSPLVLFGRLTTLAQWQEDIEVQFHYELTPEPSSFFKDGLMQKNSKTDTSNAFNTERSNTKNSIQTRCH